MVDFGSLLGGSKQELQYDLIALYDTLDVKSTHTELRRAQREALKELTARSDEKDLVLKISTGSGKTTVGLLYLYGHMRVSRAPAVYLCPTLQLVDQVLEEANRLGIAAHHYPGGTPFPHAACVRGDAITVCTYEKLFNAKSTFHRHDVALYPGAIVLDDAHAGVEIVRKQFTLRLADDTFDALTEILEPRCRKYHPTKWRDIQDRDPNALLEVPHWIWSDVADEVQQVLHGFAENNEHVLVWPFLRDIIPLCRCVIGPGQAEIAPEILPVHMVRAYHRTSHRLFMSATLVDDSVLTREIGTAPDAALKPIQPASDQGMGERMVIAPSLVDPVLERDVVMELCTQLSQTYNVVVLTSSEQRAKDWEDAGARYFAGDDFADGIDKLKNVMCRFVVFAQRYDGVDLPDDTCRVLVIDGTPFGDSLMDKADAYLALQPGGVRNRTVFRIEQGMGRAVRSHADFAVVLLVGQDLTTFVGRREVLDAMAPDTRNQLELSIKLAELTRASNPENPPNALWEVANQCLKRDPDWKAFYNARVREAEADYAVIDSDRVALAHAEREAYFLAASNRRAEAKTKLESAIDKSAVDGEEKGIYLQRLARISYLQDPPEAMKIQQGAHTLSINTALPPSLPRKPKSYAQTAPECFCRWFKSFAQPNAAVIESKRIADALDFSVKPKRLEATLQELGAALGAASSRPEQDYSEGPDNLWLWGELTFVIEAKNRNVDSLHKGDSGQLHDSLKWARDTYPARHANMVPLVVANAEKPDRDAHYPEGTRVLNEHHCQQLTTALQQLCSKLAEQGPVFVTAENAAKLMSDFRLLPEQFARTYTVGLK